VRQEHGVEALFNGVLHLVKLQQVNSGRSVFGARQNPIPVKAFNDLDGFSE